MIEKTFLENIPENLNQGIKYIIDDFYKHFPPGKMMTSPTNHENYLNYWALLEAFLKSHDYEFPEITLDDNKAENFTKIDSFIASINRINNKRLTKDLISDTKEKYNILFKNSFFYEFTDGDLQKIQQLINELRDLITKSELFTAEHQQRILRKLEKLQGELHKKVSNLDRFWGLLGDAGVALGKFGNDAKPFVDRIKEMTDIVWRTQAKAEELPSGYKTPLLTDNRDNE